MAQNSNHFMLNSISLRILSLTCLAHECGKNILLYRNRPDILSKHSYKISREFTITLRIQIIYNTDNLQCTTRILHITIIDITSRRKI